MVKELGECEYPGCRAPAALEYNKTMLCKDCFERERARMNAMLEDNMID